MRRFVAEFSSSDDDTRSKLTGSFLFFYSILVLCGHLFYEPIASLGITTIPVNILHVCLILLTSYGYFYFELIRIKNPKAIYRHATVIHASLIGVWIITDIAEIGFLASYEKTFLYIKSAFVFYLTNVLGLSVMEDRFQREHINRFLGK